MRVALVMYLKDSLGGAERRLIRVYNEICSESDEIDCDIVVRGCDLKTAKKLFEQADCNTEHIKKIVAYKHFASCLAYIMFCPKYRVVQFFSASRFNLAVERVCKISHKKSLYTICGYREACNIAISEKGTEMVKQQLKNADYVDLLNPSGTDYVKKYVKGKLSITPGTFTDLKVFLPKEKEKTIVYAAARLDITKNPQLLVDAVNLCQNELREKGYKVFLLGKGDLEGKLRNSIKEYTVDDILIMPGYGKTSEFTPQAAVFLSLQSMENYPSQSLAEAAASGCYLIITDVGDSRKCADESFASFIKDSPDELAESLVNYINFPDEKKVKIIQHAREFSEIHYSIEDSKKYFKNLLLSAEKEG